MVRFLQAAAIGLSVLAAGLLVLFGILYTIFVNPVPALIVGLIVWAIAIGYNFLDQS